MTQYSQLTRFSVTLRKIFDGVPKSFSLAVLTVVSYRHDHLPSSFRNTFVFLALSQSRGDLLPQYAPRALPEYDTD